MPRWRAGLRRRSRLTRCRGRPDRSEPARTQGSSFWAARSSPPGRPPPPPRAASSQRGCDRDGGRDQPGDGAHARGGRGDDRRLPARLPPASCAAGTCAFDVDPRPRRAARVPAPPTRSTTAARRLVASLRSRDHARSQLRRRGSVPGRRQAWSSSARPRPLDGSGQELATRAASSEGAGARRPDRRRGSSQLGAVAFYYANRELAGARGPDVAASAVVARRPLRRRVGAGRHRRRPHGAWPVEGRATEVARRRRSRRGAAGQTIRSAARPSCSVAFPAGHQPPAQRSRLGSLMCLAHARPPDPPLRGPGDDARRAGARARCAGPRRGPGGRRRSRAGSCGPARSTSRCCGSAATPPPRQQRLRPRLHRRRAAGGGERGAARARLPDLGGVAARRQRPLVARGPDPRPAAGPVPGRRSTIRSPGPWTALPRRAGGRAGEDPGGREGGHPQRRQLDGRRHRVPLRRRAWRAGPGRPGRLRRSRSAPAAATGRSSRSLPARSCCTPTAPPGVRRIILEGDGEPFTLGDVEFEFSSAA